MTKQAIFKSIIFFVLAIFSTHTFQAQSLDLKAALPLDDSFKKGVLENGLTYYIKSTDVTKDVASYYIIQNVGSILENDDQQGLAHFLEHMAFNGTKSFEGKGILNTLQKHGLVFGDDINAYTSFDETVYNINNIPTNSELIDTGLLILKEWSNYLSLTDEEIDAERGVVKEEWRTGQTGSMRIFKKKLGIKYNYSKYSKRLAIGKMDVIDNFKYKTLRDFYHDWYRTDLQAIAIVGDIDSNEIEQRIKSMFSSIPAVEHPKKRFITEIAKNKEMTYSMVTDDEIKSSEISLGFRYQKSAKRNTVGDLRDEILRNLILEILSERLYDLSAKPETPFSDAGLRYSSFGKTTSALTISVFPKVNKQLEAFTAAMREVNRAVIHGFTQGEINRIFLDTKIRYENNLTTKEDISHRSLISKIQDTYLSNIAITDIEKEYNIVKEILNSISATDLQAKLKELYTKENRFLAVTGVEGSKNLSKEDAQGILNSIENDKTILPFTDNFSGNTLTSGLTIEEGEIIAQEKNADLKSTTFTLSNGITVHHKFADKNANDVKLQALSHGGLLYLDAADLPSAAIMNKVINSSGLGAYSATDLPKVLSGKIAFTNIKIDEISESISGFSSSKDVETLLQMVYLHFVKPRFDKDGYGLVHQNMQDLVLNRKNDNRDKIQDSISSTLYGRKHPRKRLYNEVFLDDLSFKKVKKVYSGRFKDASDFEFFIVGDIKKEDLAPLLEQYIASIPTYNIKEDCKNDDLQWLSNTIDKDIFLKMEAPKGSVFINYENDYEYSLKNELLALATANYLSLRFIETLREEEGGTYGAAVSGGISKRPQQKANISVNFDCNPDKVETLISIVHREIKKLAAGEVSQVGLDKILTSYIKGREQERDYNKYDMDLLINYFREGYNMNDPKNFETIVKGIKVKDIQHFAKTLLKDGRSFEIVFKPKA